MDQRCNVNSSSGAEHVDKKSHLGLIRQGSQPAQVQQVYIRIDEVIS
jgi:hypothetical protein